MQRQAAFEGLSNNECRRSSTAIIMAILQMSILNFMHGGIGPRAALSGLPSRDGRRPLTSYTEVRVYDPVTDSWANSQVLNGNSLIVVGEDDGGIAYGKTTAGQVSESISDR
jgi:hypothetical protein